MKNIAVLLASVLASFAPLAAHASPIAAGIDVSLTSGTTNYTLIQTVPGTFVFSDELTFISVTHVGTPVSDVFNVTDVCVSINFTPCTQYALSITDTNFAGVALDAGVSAYAAAHTTLSTNSAVVTLDGSFALGTDTIVFSGTPVPANSPVPEPGTMSLMATGLLGAAATLRRRFLA